ARGLARSAARLRCDRTWNQADRVAPAAAPDRRTTHALPVRGSGVTTWCGCCWRGQSGEPGEPPVSGHAAPPRRDFPTPLAASARPARVTFAAQAPTTRGKLDPGGPPCAPRSP